ncbi:unnamed protein product [Closterium sp. NIES-65]|nr:unnamed protein product [Closterium sp. NIES-65]
MLRLSLAHPPVPLCPGPSHAPSWPCFPPRFAAAGPSPFLPPALVRPSACWFCCFAFATLLSESLPFLLPGSARVGPPFGVPRPQFPARAVARQPDLRVVAVPLDPAVLAGPAAMTGKRRRSSHSDREVGSAAPSPSRAQEGLAPVLLRGAAALVEHEGARTPARRRELIYRSPRGRNHPHPRAHGGSFRRRRPPRPAPAIQREIVGPLLQPQPSSLRLGASPVQSPAVSSQSSRQLTSGVAAPPPPLSPALPAPSAPLPAPPPSSPPPLAPPPLSSSAGAPLVPHPPSQPPSASLPSVEPPQRQHPLVPSGPAPEARFPPPRARSLELLPDAPDPNDDERWWNGELWESPPQPATLWDREWDIQSDFMKNVLRWEKRMVAVGECMSLGVVREAAAQGLWRLLRLLLESEFLDLDEGPGARAFRQVAKAAEESPLQLVPALAVLLRWIRRRFYVLNRV